MRDCLSSSVDLLYKICLTLIRFCLLTIPIMYVDLDLKTLQLFKKKYMRNYSTENILDDGKISAQSKMKKSRNRWILPNWCSKALILNKHLNHTNTTCSNYQEIKSFVWTNSLFNNFKSHHFGYEMVPKRSANNGKGAICINQKMTITESVGCLLT